MIRDDLPKTIVGLTPPRQQFSDLPQAYKIRVVAPGDSKPSSVSLSRLMALPDHNVTFSLGMERGPNPAHLRRFTEQSSLDLRVPVQLLIGNHLTAIEESRRNSLGTMSLFRDENGRTHRGVIVKPGKVDLTKLPVLIPSARVLEALIARFLDAGSGIDVDSFLVWVGTRESSRVHFWLDRNGDGSVNLRVRLPDREHSKMFYRDNPDLWIPATAVGRFVRRSYRNVEFGMSLPAEASELRDLLRATDGLDLRCDWNLRETVNQLNTETEQQTAPDLDAVISLAESQIPSCQIRSGDDLAALVAMFASGSNGFSDFNELTLSHFAAADRMVCQIRVIRKDPYGLQDPQNLGWPRMSMTVPHPERSSFYQDHPDLAEELFANRVRIGHDSRQQTRVDVSLVRDIERADRILRMIGSFGFSAEADCRTVVDNACALLAGGARAPRLVA